MWYENVAWTDTEIIHRCDCSVFASVHTVDGWNEGCREFDSNQSLRNGGIYTPIRVFSRQPLSLPGVTNTRGSKRIQSEYSLDQLCHRNTESISEFYKDFILRILGW